MMSPVKIALPTSAARLFRSGTELCPVLGFRSVDVAAEALDEASRARACRFTVPLTPPINLEGVADYELVFDGGARFPIRIRQLFIRADVQSTSVRGHLRRGDLKGACQMRVALIAVLLSFAGCVAQGTHDALQADHARTLQELEQARQGLSREEARAKSLADKLSGLQQELGMKQEELGATRKELGAKQEALGAAQKELGAKQEELGAVQKDKSSLEANVAEMRTALADLRKRKAEADARIAEYRSLLGKFKTLIDAGKLKVRISEGRMVVALATDVLFPSASATLNKEGKAAIAEVSKLLASIPDRKFQIEGHTDNVPTGGKGYRSNWDLAAGRALTVLKTMVEAGMPADRISAASFGESKPARPNDTPENKAANRRVEIVVVPDLSSLPGFDELKRASAE